MTNKAGIALPVRFPDHLFATRIASAQSGVWRPVQSSPMDAREWLGLQPTHNPMRWVLPVTPGISAGGAFLFGGAPWAPSPPWRA